MTTGWTGDCNSQRLSRVVERAGMIPAAILRSHQGQELEVPTKGRTHDHIHRPHRSNKSLATQEPSTHDKRCVIQRDRNSLQSSEQKGMRE
jgi:hypothetical protein